MSCCDNPDVRKIHGGKIWCAVCDHEGKDPYYVPDEPEGCCNNPKVTSTTYIDACSNCGYYYDYKLKKSGRR